MPFQIKAKLLKNARVKDRYYQLILSCSEVSRVAKPGQFLEIKVAQKLEPLLRRPFSIHCVKNSKIEILYEVLGPGSEILSKRKPGEYLDIIGPLGNGFSIRNSGQAILVAGGMGVAPLFFLAEKMAHSKPLVLIGAKTKDLILCEQDFKKLGCEVKIATDDGSKGYKGYVSELLESILRTTQYLPVGRQAHSRRNTTIYSCGPKPMLKEVSLISNKRKIPAQLSLEAHMACGFGVCLGCVVETQDGYKRVCQEGPVFESEKIVV